MIELIKQLFSNHEIFRELIQFFVKLDWVQNIDFSKSERVDKTFISDKYEKTESDVIYKVKLVDNTEIYCYSRLNKLHINL
ncbi:MAG: Rpn family recombination-promoting nuclease/putative transposase [Candidatus Sericytochromatia bacterium]|nr:Rpn family recombination-promoting nuclease/putative transposase [Candidatus Sericytochromatia bacterium]